MNHERGPPTRRQGMERIPVTEAEKKVREVYQHSRRRENFNGWMQFRHEIVDNVVEG